MVDKNKIWRIESIRGILALIVVLFHSQDITSSKLVNNFIIEKGYLAVDCFFFISGFVITLRYFDSISTYKNFLIFSLKRFLRLYPVHILTLIIWSLILISKFLFIYLTENVLDSKIFYRSNLESFTLNLFFLHTFLLPYPTFNFISWSISCEMYAYFIVGLIFFLTKNKRLLKLIAIIFCVFSLMYLSKSGYTFTNGIYGFLRCLASFFFGSFFYLQFYNKRYLLNNYLNILIIFLIIYLIYQNYNFPIIILFFSILFFQIIKNKNFMKILDHKFLIKLGNLSYGIFMYHMIMIWIIRQFFRFIFTFNSTINDLGIRVFNFDEIHFIIQYFFLFFLLISTIILSHFSKKYFEDYFINLGKKLNSTKIH